MVLMFLGIYYFFLLSEWRTYWTSLMVCWKQVTFETDIRRIWDSLKLIDDLGIRVSSNLSWNAHVDWKIGKASRALFNIRSCIPFTTNPQTKLRLINTLILLILLYGSQAWCPSITSMRSLMIFHFRCLKWVVGSSMEYKTCLQRSNSLPICYQLILSDQTLLWKILFNHLDINLPDYIQLSCGYSLVKRRRHTFIIKHCKKRKTEESFFTRASVQANYLSLRIVDILDPSFATYRKNLLSNLHLQISEKINLLNSCSFHINCSCSFCRMRPLAYLTSLTDSTCLVSLHFA